MIKNASKKGLRRTYLNIVNTIYDKPTANILNGEKLKAFPLRSGTRQGCPLSPLLFNIINYSYCSFISPNYNTQRRKRNKRNPDWKKEVKLFADDMILYMENPKDSIRRLLGLINEFNKVAGYKINTQK